MLAHCDVRAEARGRVEEVGQAQPGHLDVDRGGELLAEAARAVAAGALRDAVALQHHHVGAAARGEVVGDAGADHARPDDDDIRAAGDDLFHGAGRPLQRSVPFRRARPGLGSRVPRPSPIGHGPVPRDYSAGAASRGPAVDTAARGLTATKPACAG